LERFAPAGTLLGMKPLQSCLSCLLPLALALAACESNPPATAKTAPAPVAEPKPAPAPAPTPAATAPVLVLTPQKGWVVEQPANAMRKGQYTLPHADGDSEDATLIVHYFGGQGGSKEVNLKRWASQFEQPDGSSSEEKLKSSTRTIAGMEVLDAELSGTYVAETAPGSGVHLNKPGWRMFAAIVATKDGPWYFKLVGPEATVAKWEASYQAFLAAIQPSK
jgi:hypothetical protein